jgi:hypothetical protein
LKNGSLSDMDARDSLAKRSYRCGDEIRWEPTIIGSVANMIGIESAREHLQVGFGDYARFGIPITILTTFAGTAVLLALH